jgi:6,7-dimethyl-8-ribityllumazine synthase
VAIVASREHQDISRRLLRGAFDAFREHGLPDPPEVTWVPTAMEIPLAVLNLAETSRYDALVALGCLIDDETAQLQYVAGACARGLMQVQLDTGVPCAFGVLATLDREQAQARSGPKNNRGAAAAAAAIEMANVLRALQDVDAEDTAADRGEEPPDRESRQQ